MKILLVAIRYKDDPTRTRQSGQGWVKPTPVVQNYNCETWPQAMSTLTKLQADQSVRAVTTFVQVDVWSRT